MINKNKEVKRYHSNKVKPFQAQWSVTTAMPKYDALEDPHASCYFLNKSVRKHLATLKKSIAYEGSYVEKKKIRYLIAERIKDYDSIKTNNNKMVAYTFNNLKSNSSLKSLPPDQNPQKNNLRGNQEGYKKQMHRIKQHKTIDVINSNESKEFKNINLPKIVTNKKKVEQQTMNILQKQQSTIDIKNKTKHKQFIEFIENQKKKIKSQSSNMQQVDKKNETKNKKY